MTPKDRGIRAVMSCPHIPSMEGRAGACRFCIAREIQQAIEEEREACAKLVWYYPNTGSAGAFIANAIRARSSEPAKKGEKG